MRGPLGRRRNSFCRTDKLGGVADSDDDPWPDEPDEFDPESLGPDPPTVESPEPDVTHGDDLVPEKPTPGEDIDADVYWLFWGLVVVNKIGLIATSVGVMIVGFTDRTELGLQVLSVGLVALAYGVVRYKQFRGDDDGDDDPAEQGPDTDSTV
jgi:hypothetical protein